MTNSASSTVLESFSYDKNGNRSNYTTTTGNRLESDGTYTYTYDDEGNTLTKVGGGQYWEYAWDFRNRLIEAVNHTGSLGGAIVYEADYTCDVFDRRIGILEDTDGTGGSAAVQTWTLYDGANAWEDFNSGGSLTMRYLNGPGMDERYARKTSGGANSWYLTDNVNSVRQIVGTTGSVGYSASYTAFGTIASQSGAGGDRFKYTGREWDSGTGQYFYRARYYGADVGRFRSEDPIGFAGGDENLYRYVKNAPTQFLDPTGMAKLGSAELRELLFLLRINPKSRAQEARQASLLERLEKEGVIVNGAEDVAVLKDIIDAASKLRGDIRFALLGIYVTLLELAIRGLGDIAEAQYQQYKRNRDGGAPHDDAYTWNDPQVGERFRLRYEIEKLLETLKTRQRQLPKPGASRGQVRPASAGSPFTGCISPPTLAMFRLVFDVHSSRIQRLPIPTAEFT